ncbi:hypothetical protein [Maribacter cobaltidurans]|uniref:Uncharacterized protein n=1 Tax=Maribacter cobaltidurans TaxID=1178778 RepID=A0A223VC87_9FLAO|nr:hypothetical protein [Maribacter cobaltidurans]ASV32439.1 hypothetical protein CJ263_20605 [Maribacter cobaltidurans]GGD75533.1 hypothetical protein GCM10011412_11560 [Maribacter cobaltidurans]
MRRTILIIGMAIAVVTIIYSFFGMGDTGQFFGFEMNIWFYRLIWFGLFLLVLKDYLKMRK